MPDLSQKYMYRYRPVRAEYPGYNILTVIELFNENSVSLFVENIGMYSIIDNKPDPAFKMIVSVLGNVAEMGRDYLRERQKQGIEIAKARGTYKGRLYGTGMTNEQLLDKYKIVVKELEENRQSLRRAALLGKCSLGTVQKIKRIMQQQDNCSKHQVTISYSLHGMNN